MSETPEVPPVETPAVETPVAETPAAPVRTLTDADLEALAEKIAARQAPEPEPEPEAAGETDLMQQVAAQATNDPAARLALRTAQAQIIRGQLDSIPDPALREEVRQQIIRADNPYRSVAHAEAAIRAKKLEAETQALRAENAKLKAKPATEEETPVATSVREAPAGTPTVAAKMKEADFDAKIAELRSQGKHKDVMALQQKLRKSEITLTS